MNTREHLDAVAAAVRAHGGIPMLGNVGPARVLAGYHQRERRRATVRFDVHRRDLSRCNALGEKIGDGVTAADAAHLIDGMEERA